MKATAVRVTMISAFRSYSFRRTCVEPFGLGVLCLAAAGAALSSTPSARACSPPSNEEGLWLSSITNRVPADGVVVVGLACTGCREDEAFELIVENLEGERVPGAVVDSQVSFGEGWAAWLAEEHLDQNDQYTMRVEAASVVEMGEFSFGAVEAMGRTTPETLPTIRQEAYVSLDGEYICCEDSDLDSCGDVECFRWPESGEQKVGISATWFDDTERHNLDHVRQFAYRGRFFNRDVDEESDWYPGYSAGGTFAPAEEYCYEIHAKHLASGTETVLTEDCVAGDEVPLPDVEEAVTDERRWGLQQCTVPPTELATEWCEAFAEQLQSNECEGVNNAGCEAAIAACEPPAAGEDDGPQPTPTEDDELIEESDDLESDAEATQAGSCGFSPRVPGRVGRWGVFGFLGLSLVLGRRRRR